MQTLLQTNDRALLKYGCDTLVLDETPWHVTPMQLALVGCCCLWAAWFNTIGRVWIPARS